MRLEASQEPEHPEDIHHSGLSEVGPLPLSVQTCQRGHHARSAGLGGGGDFSLTGVRTEVQQGRWGVGKHYKTITNVTPALIKQSVSI